MPESPLLPDPFPTQADTPTLAHLDPALASSPALMVRTLGNYDLLEEVGRGGMGVVFKARHRTLNRVVALKMILTGQLASADDVRRFRTEAEAAALLDHPNIVPVFEVGDESGQHFFACKLIDGGPLTGHVPRLLQDPREAAHLLAKVARAVQHAHERGVLHRDLKPANVLIDAQGEPHVADFGLARRAGDAGQTQSGAIVGTPGYMAPEQARAEKGLTTAVDIYSLGAILYECLTGRPPFQADTALETVLQVLEKEPVPPSALNPRVDPELEAVCLKCLAKEPTHRYPSASALADDLEAWLAGGPVTARPPSTLGRLRQWLRKEFRTASLTILVSCVLGALFSCVAWGTMSRDAALAQTVYATFFPSEKPPTLVSLLSEEATPSEEMISTWVKAPAPRGGLGTFIFLLVMLFGGLLNALVLRPKNRGAALSTGLATGLVTAVISLLLGSGYFMSGYAGFTGEAELDLMADGYRAESLQRQSREAGRPSRTLDEWDREIEKAHPDLTRADFPRQERGRALAYKIVIDHRTKMLVSMWIILAAVGVFHFLPVVSQTLLAQALGARGDRRAVFFLHYLELGLPGTLLIGTLGTFVIEFVRVGGEATVLRAGAMLVWIVAGGLLFDKVVRWRLAVMGGWLLVGVALLASYLHLAATSMIAVSGLQLTASRLVWIVFLVALVTVSSYGVFVGRWRWYVRFAVYLGIVPVAAAVIYFVTR